MLANPKSYAQFYGCRLNVISSSGMLETDIIATLRGGLQSYLSEA